MTSGGKYCPALTVTEQSNILKQITGKEEEVLVWGVLAEGNKMNLVIATHEPAIRRNKVRGVIFVVASLVSRIGVDTDTPHNDRRSRRPGKAGHRCAKLLAGKRPTQRWIDLDKIVRGLGPNDQVCRCRSSHLLPCKSTSHALG